MSLKFSNWDNLQIRQIYGTMEATMFALKRSYSKNIELYYGSYHLIRNVDNAKINNYHWW